MTNKEFQRYLQAQLREINAYILLKKRFSKKMCDNDLALEWICKYAEGFKNRWDKRGF